MKPGLAIGQTSRSELHVTDDMSVRFDGKLVHELYSTSSLVLHMEQTARKLIVPYLDADEEGMGCHVEVSHLAITLPGMTIEVVATVSDIRDNKIVAEVEASNLRGKIARGTVTQAIIKKQWLDNRMKEMAVLQNIAAKKQAQPPVSSKAASKN